MGMIRLNFKWGSLSVQYPASVASVSSQYCKGRGRFCFLAKLSVSSVLFDEAEAISGSSRTHVHSSSSHFLENSFLGSRDIKVVGTQGSSDDLQNHGVELLNNEDGPPYFSSLNATRTSQFRLLMKNLDILENMFADSNARRLEEDILEKLKRLGAIHLFNSCLSKTLSSASSSCTTSDDVLDELQSKDSENNSVEDVIIPGRGGLRKERRKRAFQLGSDKSGQQCRDSEIKPASAQPMPRSRNKRQKLAKSEADMASGVKSLAELEKIRRMLEASEQRASFRTWAEAAGIETNELWRRLHYGLRCRDELLRTSRSLVVYIAKNYRGHGIAFEDLIQAGNMAVMHGAERFDQSRGYKFSTYVQYWIRKYMSMLVARHARGVRIPGTLSKVINQVQNARKALCTSIGKHPSDTEISQLTGLSIERIQSASKCLRVVGSIDQKIGDSISIKFMEVMSDESIRSSEEVVTRQHLVQDIHTLLRGLQLIEQQVLVLRFGIGDKNHQSKSLDEIGKLLCVSKEWIRKIEKRALTKLRTENSLNTLRHYIYTQ